MVLVYTSVMFAAEATVLGPPAGTLTALLEATVYVYKSPVPSINEAKSKFKATSLHVVTV